MYLCSEFHYVHLSVAKKLGRDVGRRAVFINTPLQDKKRSDKDLDFHYKNIEALKAIGINFDFYDLAGKSESELKLDLGKYGLMYVEGGNPFYLLARSLENNFGGYLKTRLEQGLIYLSTSAGSLITGPDISSVNRPGKTAAMAGLTDTTGFNIVNFNLSPHWGSPSKKDIYLQYKIPNSYREDHPYILVSNYQYVEVDGDWINIVDVRNETHEK